MEGDERMSGTQTAEAIPLFELGQKVSIQDVRRIVAPTNTLDFVEEFRLRLASAHVAELLRPDLPSAEAGAHAAYLGSLGAGEVLDYLPQR